MKTFIPLILLADMGLAACKPPTGPQTSSTPICDSVGAKSVNMHLPTCAINGGDYWRIQLTDSVSPTRVRAGDLFIAVARARAGAVPNCSIQITYANVMHHGGSGDPASFAVALTAILGNTVVAFQAYCDGYGWGFANTPVNAVTIEVLPAQ